MQSTSLDMEFARRPAVRIDLSKLFYFPIVEMTDFECGKPMKLTDAELYELMDDEEEDKEDSGSA